MISVVLESSFVRVTKNSGLSEVLWRVGIASLMILTCDTFGETFWLVKKIC